MWIYFPRSFSERRKLTVFNEHIKCSLFQVFEAFCLIHLKTKKKKKKAKEGKGIGGRKNKWKSRCPSQFIWRLFTCDIPSVGILRAQLDAVLGTQL